MLTNVRLNGWLASIRNYGSADLSVALQHSGDDGLTKVVKLASLVPLALMHVSRLAADHGFVRLNRAAGSADLSACGFILHCKANPVEHKPCSLLGNAKIAGDLTTTNSVLAPGEQPDNRQPLFQTERR